MNSNEKNNRKKNASSNSDGNNVNSSKGNKRANLIKELRAVVPTRPLTLSESYTLAERKAGRALSLIGIVQLHVELGWIVDLPRVEIRLSPRFKMDGFSGATTFTQGRYLVLVNKNEDTPGAALRWRTSSSTCSTTRQHVPHHPRKEW